MYGPEYLEQLRAADPARMLREADQLFARVLNDYGEIAFTPPYAQPTRETLADVVRRERRPGPITDPWQFRTLRGGLQFRGQGRRPAADEAQKKAGRAEPGEERACLHGGLSQMA